MRKTYHGSCHCGAIAFETDIDLSEGTNRCNCTFCRKTRNWTAAATPDAFRITRGHKWLRRYDASGQSINAHCFCGKCGVRLFSEGDIPELGGAYVAVAIATLDDVDDEALSEAPVNWMDGLNDNWWEAPTQTRHL
ncbi:GFA family protein [Cognatiyoonia sp. IB215182]|uniref:GFA family protein n=1 Tax=Cognatiyoonia sp. IB215182 TaxID=3097353 RepID=UPI002A0EC3BC|nr:GFA family protein [Cognatiyoonia sp. IB215182]MDX8355623.1 GFA family protein [Cognatiyoonia sp. IB215182]